MTTTIKADGVPTPKQIKEPFVVKVECFWRDHANNYEPRSVMRTFKGKDKADVIAGYAQSFLSTDLGQIYW